MIYGVRFTMTVYDVRITIYNCRDYVQCDCLQSPELHQPLSFRPKGENDVRFTVYDVRCTMYELRYTIALTTYNATACSRQNFTSFVISTEGRKRCSMFDVRCTMYEVGILNF